MSLKYQLLFGAFIAATTFATSVSAQTATKATNKTQKPVSEVMVIESETISVTKEYMFKPYFAARTGVAMTDSYIDKNVWFGSLAIGTKIQDFRMEIEYTYRDKVAAFYESLNNKLSSQNLMYNVYYDLPLQGKIKPFISAGAGYARLTSEVNSYKETFNEFAWSVGAGVGFNVAKNVDLDVAYRYVDVDSGDFKSNELYAGVRIGF